MRALFVTTQTNDTHNHIDAWDSVSDTPAKRVHFYYRRATLGNDAYILRKARGCGEVDVIFYIGANAGEGLPSFETLRELRRIAPVVNIISDAADKPWHRPIARYRKEECFDLQVGIDGDPDSPVDHVTLTPVDARPWDAVNVERDIRCGFSGNASGKRAEVLQAVGSRCFIRLRGDDYQDHVEFSKRCRMILNVSYTGSGNSYHVKGRVTEAGYAGAALIESSSSPTRHWFPKHCYPIYRNIDDLLSVLDTLSEERIADYAAKLSQVVREKYNAAAIYGGILGKTCVGNPF